MFVKRRQRGTHEPAAAPTQTGVLQPRLHVLLRTDDEGAHLKDPLPVLDHSLAALKHGKRGGEGKGEEGGRGPAVLDHPLAALKHGGRGGEGKGEEGGGKGTGSPRPPAGSPETRGRRG